MKRLIAFMLAALMVTSVAALASCSNNVDNPDANTTASDTSTALSDSVSEIETEISDDLPEADFKGHNFRLLMFEDALSGTWTFDAKELTGEIINDDIYNRNRDNEVRFNYVMETIPTAYGSTANLVKNSVAAGDRAYDMIAIHSVDSAVGLVQNRLLYNWLKVPYINFEKPWTHSQINETLSIGGYLPFVSNDFSLNSYMYTHAIIFNKEMAAAEHTEDIYALVDDGKMNKNDTYGFASNHSYHANTWITSAGEVSLTAKDGAINLNYTEKIYNVAEFVAKLFVDSGVTWKIEHDQPCVIKWDENRVFMEVVWLHDLENDEFRGSNSAYGIIPFPKIDESQTDYKTYVDARGYFFCLPVDSEDVARSGMILESLAAASYKTLVPDYLHVVLSKKLASDPDSSCMLEIIMKGRVWDFAYIYPATSWYSVISNYILSGASGDFASTVTKLEKSTTKLYQKLVDIYVEMAAQ